MSKTSLEIKEVKETNNSIFRANYCIKLNSILYNF